MKHIKHEDRKSFKRFGGFSRTKPETSLKHILATTNFHKDHGAPFKFRRNYAYEIFAAKR